MTKELERRFDSEMRDVYEEAKRIGYNATYFLRMLADLGGLATAKKLINSSAPSDGFTKLWELGHLELSVESLALRPEFGPLFTAEELTTARKRLKNYGFGAR